MAVKLSLERETSKVLADVHTMAAERVRPANFAARCTALGRNRSAAAIPAAFAAADTALYKPDDCKPSRFPIFREHQCVTYQPPAADMTRDELQRLTFRQWLQYYLGHPVYARQRSYMFTDEQYCCMLGFVTGKQQRVVDYKGALNLDKPMTDWLYRQHNECTY